MAIDTLDRNVAARRDPSARTLTLLVGFDGSEESRAALRAAMERAGPDDRIAVVHAYPRVSEWMGFPYYDEALLDTQREARRVLEQAAEVADDSSAEVSVEMHEGAPADVLARIAAVRGADEIIVGTRGLGRLRAALGSVAQELVRTADRPVLVVPSMAAEAA